MPKTTWLYENAFEHNYKLWVREYNPQNDQVRVRKIPDNQSVPSLYFPTKENSKYVTFDSGTPLKKIEFDNTYKLFQYWKQVKDNPNVYGSLSRVHEYIREHYPNPKDANHKFRYIFFDIEVSTKGGKAHPNTPWQPITLISSYSTHNNTFYLFGTKEEKDIILPTTDVPDSKVKYIYCSDEKQILIKFFKLYKHTNPAGIIGFNSKFFDVPYVINRCNTIGGEVAEAYSVLSPLGIDGIELVDDKTLDGMYYKGYNLKGTYNIDFRDLYIQFRFDKIAKYSLEEVAKANNLDGKIKYTGSLDSLMDTQYSKFLEYGMVDVEILVIIENNLQLVDTPKNISYICGTNLDNCYQTLPHWQEYYYQHAYNQNRILPLKQRYQDPNILYLGGWTRSIPGIYKNVVGVDAKSLYPSCQIAINIGLDSYIKPQDLHPELQEIKAKYFSFYIQENRKYFYGAESKKPSLYEKENGIEYFDEEIESGKNDNIHEMKHIVNVIKNRAEINKVLKAHNVSVSPSGFFFTQEFQSLGSESMENALNERSVYKGDAETYETELKVLEKGTKEYKDSQDRFNSSFGLSYTYKFFANSHYGSNSLVYCMFSTGKSTTAAITSTSRFINRYVGYVLSKWLDDFRNDYIIVINGIEKIIPGYKKLKVLRGNKIIKLFPWEINKDDKLELFEVT